MVAPHPLIIIGLDGGTFEILEPLFRQGQLPHLHRLATEGIRTELLSTMPPATLPAWTSFLTAAPPGIHGVVDIFHHPNTYDLRPMNGRLRGVPTCLKRLSSMGFSVASVGVPGTFPPEPVRGLSIAGFDAPGVTHATRQSVWPPSLFDTIRRLGGWRYATFNEHAADRRRPHRAVEALLKDLDTKERIALRLFTQQPWDLFFLHLQASDTAAHHLWHAYDATSPRANGDRSLGDALPRVYRRLDRLIGRLLAHIPKQGRVLVVSDHGMGGASTTAVHLNRWLHRQGWLHFRKNRPSQAQRAVRSLGAWATGRLPPVVLGTAIRQLPAGWSAALGRAIRTSPIQYASTLAFSDELDYAPSIWFNRRGVFPQGVLEAPEADRLSTKLQENLMQLRDPTTGAPLIRAVHRRDDVVAGAFMNRAPDLIVEPAWIDGYRPSFLPSDEPGSPVRQLTAAEYGAGKGYGLPGVHRREGVFLAHGDGLSSTEIPPLTIEEAGAIIYPLLGVPSPVDLATPLPDFLETWLPPSPTQESPSFDATRPSVPSRAYPSDVAMLPGSKQEDAIVMERLRRLGYVD